MPGLQRTGRIPLVPVLLALGCLDSFFSQSVAFAAAPAIASAVSLDHPAAGDQDDLCFWHDAAAPERSLIITSDKKKDLVAVYDLSGKLLQLTPVPKPGNIDIRQGVLCDGVARDLVVVNQRTDGFKLVVLEVDRTARRLKRLDQNDLTTGPNYGVCLYRSRKTENLHAVITSETGGMEQYALSVNSKGETVITLERRWQIGKSEGAVADDELGKLYISEEEGGVWELGAEPDQPTPGELVIRLGEHGLKADLEGIALINRGDTAGYLLLSSQGSNQIFVYQRAGKHEFVGRFAVEGAEETDGLDVIAQPLGPGFPEGVFGCHTAQGRCRVLLTSWQAIADQITGQ